MRRGSERRQGNREAKERDRQRKCERQRGDRNERSVRFTKLIASQQSSLINEATDV